MHKVDIEAVITDPSCRIISLDFLYDFIQDQ